MDKQAAAGIDFNQYVIRYDLIKVPAPAAAKSMPAVIAYERKTLKEGGMIGFKDGRSSPLNPEQFKQMAQAMRIGRARFTANRTRSSVPADQAGPVFPRTRRLRRKACR